MDKYFECKGIKLEMNQKAKQKRKGILRILWGLVFIPLIFTVVVLPLELFVFGSRTVLWLFEDAGYIIMMVIYALGISGVIAGGITLMILGIITLKRLSIDEGFVLSKVTTSKKGMTSVIANGLADANKVVVMLPLEFYCAEGQEIDRTIGSIMSALLYGADIQGNMATHKARPPENFRPEVSLLTNIAHSYLGLFVVSVCDNGDALAFTPCSQGLVSYEVNDHEISLSVKFAKDDIASMNYVSKEFVITMAWGGKIIFNKKHVKKIKPALDEMMRLFGF